MRFGKEFKEVCGVYSICLKAFNIIMKMIFLFSALYSEITVYDNRNQTDC